MEDDQLVLPPGYVQKQSLVVPPAGYVPKTSQQISQGFESAGREAPPYIGRFGAQALPAIGAGVGEFLEPAGGGYGGSLVGTGAKQLLQSLAPLLFGQAPNGIAENLVDAGSDVAGNVLVPKALTAIGNTTLPKLMASPLFRNFPAVRQGVATNLTGNLLNKYQFPESGVIESAAQNALDNKSQLIQNITDAFNAHPESIDKAPKFYHPEVRQAIAGHENTFGRNTVGEQLVKLQQEFDAGTDVAKSQTYKQIANTALSDLTHVRNFQLATGEPKTIEQLAVNKLATNGFKASDGTLDTKYILNELGGKNKEVYEEAINPKTLEAFKEMVGEINSQKEGHEISDRTLNWSKGHLMWTLPMAAAGTLEGGGIGATIGALGAASTATVLTNKALGHLMSNPETAKLVVQAMKTPATAPEAPLIQKVLVNVLRGAAVPALTKQE